MTSFRVSTKAQTETVDISQEVAEAVREAGVEEGLVCVSTPHTTAAVYVNENERGLRRDVVALARTLLAAGEGFEHNQVDHNAEAHLMAVLMGNSVVLPVRSGRPELGTWQRVFLLEMDGPRHRTVHVTVVPGAGD
jgi:secondary thiamine-phosphate synthase enzyme